MNPCRVQYMHSQSPPLVHRDMKQENVLLTRSRGRLQAKIADLGLYTVCGCVPCFLLCVRNVWPSGESRTVCVRVGCSVGSGAPLASTKEGWLCLQDLGLLQLCCLKLARMLHRAFTAAVVALSAP